MKFLMKGQFGSFDNLGFNLQLRERNKKSISGAVQNDGYAVQKSGKEAVLVAF